jgi:hypothetical protein
VTSDEKRSGLKPGLYNARRKRRQAAALQKPKKARFRKRPLQEKLAAGRRGCEES